LLSLGALTRPETRPEAPPVFYDFQPPGEGWPSGVLGTPPLLDTRERREEEREKEKGERKEGAERSGRGGGDGGRLRAGKPQVCQPARGDGGGPRPG
jgi:hypothetical protein